MAKAYVNRGSAANRREYAKVLERIEQDGVCPFCEDYFFKYHTRPTLKKSAHWFVTENMSPYRGTKRHILFVYRGHIDNIGKLSPAAAGELMKLAAWVQKKYDLPGAGLFMRTGDTRYTGASVRHLHANLVSGARQRKGAEPIAVTLGFKR
jgi:diadenosine tetraphosphate (Ap4A) HIT family hydrolase